MPEADRCRAGGNGRPVRVRGLHQSADREAARCVWISFTSLEMLVGCSDTRECAQGVGRSGVQRDLLLAASAF